MSRSSYNNIYIYTPRKHFFSVHVVTIFLFFFLCPFWVTSDSFHFLKTPPKMDSQDDPLGFPRMEMVWDSKAASCGTSQLPELPVPNLAEEIWVSSPFLPLSTLGPGKCRGASFVLPSQQHDFTFKYSLCAKLLAALWLVYYIFLCPLPCWNCFHLA